MGPNDQFVKNIQYLRQKSLLFGNCCEVPLASVKCNLFAELEASFGNKGCTWSSVSPLIMQFYLDNYYVIYINNIRSA